MQYLNFRESYTAIWKSKSWLGHLRSAFVLAGLSEITVQDLSRFNHHSLETQ